MVTLDVRDWLVMCIVTCAWLASTVFLFLHPDPANFATWAALGATMTGAYHWICYRDQKEADRC
jgi:membrane protease YdiL (CAAX protease family)